ncbi:STYKc [Musa troglodytarum]|uniref:STYKc n=1 Tax=Musa troglodytarum TaxID=320322 RepID=A0A9E7KI96_9LILI|nr:STYKc [Musa troglodytarum]
MDLFTFFFVHGLLLLLSRRAACACGPSDREHIALAFRSVSGFKLPPPPPAADDPGCFLRLPSRNLSGTVSWMYLRNVTALRALDLSGNALHGSVPGGFWSAPALLEVNLAANRLGGALRAAGLAALSRLEILDLSHNGLGLVPLGLDKLRMLRHLDMSYNSMRGKFGKSAFLKAGSLRFGSPAHVARSSSPTTLASHKDTKLKGRRRKRKRRKDEGKLEEKEAVAVAAPPQEVRWVVEAKWSAPVVLFEKPLMETTFGDLVKATSGFGKESQLAEGGRSGPAYRAVLDGDMHVVVRVVEAAQEAEERDAVASFHELARLRHPNLLPLLGYCIPGKEKLALYEYMDRGDLHRWLHELPAGQPNVGDWPTRHRIALGIARALAFLHQGWVGTTRGVIHGHLLPTNVLLGNDLEPRVADFGGAAAGNAGTAEGDVWDLPFFRCQYNHSLELPIITTSCNLQYWIDQQKLLLRSEERTTMAKLEIDRIRCRASFGFRYQEAYVLKSPKEEREKAAPLSGSRGGEEAPVVASERGVQVFTYKQLHSATAGFGKGNVVNHGSSGAVYRGVLADGREVAVKIMDRPGMQGAEEFKLEVELLTHLRSPYLLMLIGHCSDGGHRILVYEFMANGGLQEHLYPRGEFDTTGYCGGTSKLGWQTRLRIALEAAKGLEYLHEHFTPPVIHRDFKTRNILLDQKFHAKVSDFGLAKLGPERAGGHVSTHVLGTQGYVAPEYALTGNLTTKSDVYSYGVVLLELLTGRVPVDMSRPPGEGVLASWALPLLSDREKIVQIMDPALEGQYSVKDAVQVAAIAAMCVKAEADYRPLMADVVHSLLPLVRNRSSAKHFDAHSTKECLGTLVAMTVPNSIFLGLRTHLSLYGAIKGRFCFVFRHDKMIFERRQASTSFATKAKWDEVEKHIANSLNSKFR